MSKEGIQNILKGMQADVTRIDAKREAFQRECEEDKELRIEMGNEALQSAMRGDLLPRHEQFEFAVKKIDTDIGELLGQLVALEHNRIEDPEKIEEKIDFLCVALSFLRFARGIAESENSKRIDLIEKLAWGIEESDLARYNDPKNSRSTYYSVLTIDEELREEEKGAFPGRYGCDREFPVLYLGKGFKGIEGEKPGTWKTDEDRIKVEEMIARKLGEFTKQGLIPPVSIELYPKSSYGGDFTYLFESPFHELRSDRRFVVAVEAECF